MTIGLSNAVCVAPRSLRIRSVPSVSPTQRVAQNQSMKVRQVAPKSHQTFGMPLTPHQVPRPTETSPSDGSRGALAEPEPKDELDWLCAAYNLLALAYARKPIAEAVQSSHTRMVLDHRLLALSVILRGRIKDLTHGTTRSSNFHKKIGQTMKTYGDELVRFKHSLSSNARTQSSERKYIGEKYDALLQTQTDVRRIARFMPDQVRERFYKDLGAGLEYTKPECVDPFAAPWDPMYLDSVRLAARIADHYR